MDLKRKRGMGKEMGRGGSDQKGGGRGREKDKGAEEFREKRSEGGCRAQSGRWDGGGKGKRKG